MGRRKIRQVSGLEKVGIKSPPGCPTFGALKAIGSGSVEVVSVGGVSWSGRRGGYSSWSLGRQLEKVPESSREELRCRVGENRKRRMGGFLAFLLPKILRKRAETTETILLSFRPAFRIRRGAGRRALQMHTENAARDGERTY